MIRPPSASSTDDVGTRATRVGYGMCRLCLVCHWASPCASRHTSTPAAGARPSRAPGRLAGPRDSLAPAVLARTFSKRLLSVVDAAPLFPQLDRGDGVPETAPHQTLVHEVLSGLLLPDCHAPAHFSDEHWNLIRSTAPHWVRHQLLSTHGLLTSSEATGSMDLQTIPIVKLVELGHCPEMPLSCLRSLVLWLLLPGWRSTVTTGIRRICLRSAAGLCASVWCR